MTVTAPQVPHPDQATCDSQRNAVGVEPLPAARMRATPKEIPLLASSGPDQVGNESQERPVGSISEPNNHQTNEPHSPVVVGPVSPHPDPARKVTDPRALTPGSGEDAELLTAVSYRFLGLAADTVDDLEKARIAAQNRRLALTKDKEVPDWHDAVQVLDSIIAGLVALEKQAVKNLEKTMAAHPLAGWVNRNAGVGLKQAARLIAAIGDPSQHPGTQYKDGTWRREPGPRRLGELNALCGMDVRNGAAPRHRKGVKSNWNPLARSRLWLVADSCIKQTGTKYTIGKGRDKGAVRQRGRSPYRDVYDTGRAKYADAVYDNGEPLSDGHQYNRAHRLVSKEILKDLWLEAGGRSETTLTAAPKVGPSRSAA